MACGTFKDQNVIPYEYGLIILYALLLRCACSLGYTIRRFILLPPHIGVLLIAIFPV